MARTQSNLERKAFSATQKYPNDGMSVNRDNLS